MTAPTTDRDPAASIPRNNNFDILRLVFAWIVVFVHCYNLSLSPSLAWFPRVFSATIAVEGFFTLSGCLIVASFDRSRGLSGYLSRRAGRILPAYYLSTIFCLILGPFLTTLPLGNFLGSKDVWKFLAANVVFLNTFHPSLPGVFDKNPYSAMNGALWTIKIEVMFYLFVPIFVHLCHRLGKAPLLVTCFAGSVLYRVLMAGHRSLALQLPGQLAFFMAGAAVYYYYPAFRRHRIWMWLVSIAAYLLSLLTGWFVLHAIGVPLLVMCMGLLLPTFRGPTRHGDFSYGTYVLHCPLIQAFVACGAFAVSPYGSVAVVIVLVALLSILSWNLVEKRFLRRERIKALEQAPAKQFDAVAGAS